MKCLSHPISVLVGKKPGRHAINRLPRINKQQATIYDDVQLNKSFCGDMHLNSKCCY